MEIKKKDNKLEDKYTYKFYHDKEQGISMYGEWSEKHTIVHVRCHRKWDIETGYINAIFKKL